MSEPWAPECAEDALLLAFIQVKRGMQHRALGADPGAFPVLHHLAVAGPCRQGALAEALSLDASTVSRHVRTLVDDGRIVASRDPEDGRATVLALTDAGHDSLRDRLAAHRAMLQEATAGFTGDERNELVRLLGKLAAALEQKES